MTPRATSSNASPSRLRRTSKPATPAPPGSDAGHATVARRPVPGEIDARATPLWRVTFDTPVVGPTRSITSGAALTFAAGPQFETVSITAPPRIDMTRLPVWHPVIVKLHEAPPPIG